MYFNIRHHRTGGLFVKPFRSRHVTDDRYFQRVLQYIHFNPAELYEPGWKDGSVRNLPALLKQLREYRYSSYAAYLGNNRAIDAILGTVGFDVAVLQDPQTMLEEAVTYYQELAMSRRRLANG